MNNDTLTWSIKIKYGIIFAVLFAISYLLPNHVHIFTPKGIPPLGIESSIPFIPWTVLIYMSEYILYIAVLFMIYDMSTFRRLLLSLFPAFFISMIIFFIFPTTLTYRPDVNINGLFGALFRFLYWADTLANCFPSQHVALVTIPMFIFWTKRRDYSILFGIWALLISVSTLTTKQHYLIDIPGGFLLACISVFLGERWYKKFNESVTKPLWFKIIP